jgi:hypothetical protein
MDRESWLRACRCLSKMDLVQATRFYASANFAGLALQAYDAVAGE